MKNNTAKIVPPFPYFGGKARVAALIWSRLGQPRHYIEPFFGSGAVLLARPDYDPAWHVETICDKDGFVANVWRALQFDPDEVAKWCDWPVNHVDLCARKAALIRNEERLLENLIADDKWCDPVMAGYWIWAASCWIGSGLTRPNATPHLGDAGMGVQSPHCGNIYVWFRALSERLRRVRVVCGDWGRVCGGNWQDKLGDAGIFFDPPYGYKDRDVDIYHHDSTAVAAKVRAWALPRGEKPSYRICIAGYDSEGADLEAAGWDVVEWKAPGGYGNTARNGESRGKRNARRERLWFSPHCLKLKSTQERLF